METQMKENPLRSNSSTCRLLQEAGLFEIYNETLTERCISLDGFEILDPCLVDKWLCELEMPLKDRIRRTTSTSFDRG